MSAPMSIYPGNTNISGGNVQFGDTHLNHFYSYNLSSLASDDQKISSWLSSLNFGEVLRRHCNKRTPETGTWLIEHCHYKAWSTCCTTQDRLLWCRGHPGTGKTILCAMVIEHLQSTLPLDEAVIYCFFDYARRQEISADAVIANFMLQLQSKHNHQVAATIRELHNNAEGGRRKPTMSELTRAFHKSISSFKRVSIVVDALDECDAVTRHRLLSALDIVHNHNIRVLIFSRPHIQLHAHVSEMDAQVFEIEIKPSAPDLRLFVDSRIAEIEDLSLVIHSSDVTIPQIADTIFAKADFSFLAAEIRLNTIGFVLTLGDLKAALKSGLSDLTALYNETFQRIKDQHVQKTTLALKVLGWVCVAKRPLTTRELCHVLAIQPGRQESSTDDMPAADVVINSCLGLIVRDAHNEQVRLLHYTLLEFIEQHGLASISQELAVETCLSCLSAIKVPPSTSGHRPSASQLAATNMRVFRTMPFSSYAAVHWFDHMSTELQILDCLSTFLATTSSILTWVGLWDFHDPRRYKQLILHPIFGRDPLECCLGIKVALAMGWEVTAQRLRNGAQFSKFDLAKLLIEIMDTRSIDLLKIMLFDASSEAFAHPDQEGFVHQAVARDYPTAITLLARIGIDLNQRNAEEQTPLHVSILKKQELCCISLLQNGADVNAVYQNDASPLLLALRVEASENLVNFILRYHPHVNFKNALGETSAHVALRYYSAYPKTQASIVEAWLEQVADVSAATNDGYSVLHYACIWSGPYTVVDAIINKYGRILRHQQKDDTSRQCLLTSLGECYSQTEHDKLMSIIDGYSEDAENHSNDLPRESSLIRAKAVTSIVLHSILRRRSPVNGDDRRGRSPLHRAVQARRADLVLLLLKAGVPADHRDHKNKTALDLALAIAYPDSHYAQPLLSRTDILSAEDYAACSVLKQLLRVGGLEDALTNLLPFLNEHDLFVHNGCSILLGAILAGHSAAIIEKLLLQFPGHINSQDKYGDTAITMAVFHGRPDLILLLLSHGANVCIDGREGVSALLRLLIREVFPNYKTGPHPMQASQVSAVVASITGDWTMTLRKLLKAYAHPYQRVDDLGLSALHVAIGIRQPLHFVRDIAESMRNVDEDDSVGNTALHHAVLCVVDCRDCEQGHVCLSIPRFLVKNNANVNKLNDQGETPLTLAVKQACKRQLMHTKAKESSICDLFDLLLSQDTNPLRPNFDVQSLLYAIKNLWYQHFTPREATVLMHFERNLRRIALQQYYKTNYSYDDVANFFAGSVRLSSSIGGPGNSKELTRAWEFLSEETRLPWETSSAFGGFSLRMQPSER